MALKPESSFHVTVSGRSLTCRDSDGNVRHIALDDVHAVYFQAAAEAHAADWWIIEGTSPNAHCEFPLGATGEAEALDWLKQLPGFEIKGMNSVEDTRFLCWSRDARRGA